MPATPLQVILSLMTRADMTSVMMGLSVLMMDASMAVVFVMANRKESWVMKRPRNEAMTTFQTSSLWMCSCGAVNRDHSQKRAVAPKERRQKSAMGVTFPSSAMLLQLMMLNPKMA